MSSAWTLQMHGVVSRVPDGWGYKCIPGLGGGSELYVYGPGPSGRIRTVQVQAVDDSPWALSHHMTRRMRAMHRRLLTARRAMRSTR